MTAGQGGFAGALDVAGLDAVCERLEAGEVARSAAYAQTLSDALLLDRLLCDAGMGISSGADLALRLRCSQWRAERLLEQARVLSDLPDGLRVLAEGLLTVEQVGVFVVETARLGGSALLRVWEQLVARLRAGLVSGEVLPPGRLATVLRRWVLSAAPLDAVKERQRAEADAPGRRRGDGGRRPSARWRSAGATTGWQTSSPWGSPDRTPMPACPGSRRRPLRWGRMTGGRQISAGWTRWWT